MQLRRLALVALGLAGLSAILSAQEAPAPLTVEEAIQRALRRNFSLEAERLSPEIARDAVEVARGGFLPEFTFDQPPPPNAIA